MDAAEGAQKRSSLIEEVRRTLRTDPPTSPAARTRLSRLVSRPGVPELLVDVLLRGDVADAHLAAFPLSQATNELVRRRLFRAARTVGDERRAAVLSSLTENELARLFAGRVPPIDEAIVQASGLLAANAPEEFAELLVAARIPLDEKLLAHLEPLRRSFGLGAVTLYEPLLARNLTPEGRREIIRILGREPGEQAAALLERELHRSLDEDERRGIRRERMRQGSPTSNEPTPPSGSAFLSPLRSNGAWVLDVFHEVGPGRVVRASHLVAPTGRVELSTLPEDEALSAIRATRAEAWAELSLARAKFVLQRLPRTATKRVAPTLERLAAVEPEPLVPPVPGGAFTMEEANALVAAPGLFTEWRPFAPIVPALVDPLLVDRRVIAPRLDAPGGADPAPTDSQIADPQIADRPVIHAYPPSSTPFPVTAETIEVLADQTLEVTLAKRGAPARLAAALRHAATWLALRGDTRAERVSFEAYLVAKRRPGQVLLRALVLREIRHRLWMQATLPDAYRQQLREAARRALESEQGRTGETWEDVRLLDFAQAALEGLAREAGQSEETPRLPAVETLDAVLACRFAGWADVELRDTLARPRLSAKVAARAFTRLVGWLPGAPMAMLASLLRFRDEACRGGCPHGCWNRSPEGAPKPVFLGRGWDEKPPVEPDEARSEAPPGEEAAG